MTFSLSGRPFQVEALMTVFGSPAGTGWEYDPSVLTYSFSTNASTTFRNIYSDALAELEGFINVSFQQSQDEDEIESDFSNYSIQNGSDTSADLRLSQQSDNTREGGYGGADFWTNDSDADMEDIDSFNLIWSTNYYTILHELGHALTLKHPSSNQNPDEEPYLLSSEQTNNHTVMHYYLEGDENSVVDPDEGEWDYRHFQLYDVYALQLRFGANMSTYSGNNTHTATSLAADQWLQVLWDAGGTDTIDMSAQSRAQVIDLRDGQFSNLGATAGNNPLGHNLAIAFNAVIENAIGGSGADILIGNAGANSLTGGAGADTMTGGTGDDFYFVDGGDTVVEGASQGTGDRVFASTSYTLSAGAYIEIMSTDYHAGTGAINLTGNALDNVIYGNAGANSLNGGAGADAMVGFGGADWFFVDNAGDYIVEGASEGTADRVFASTSYTLSAGAYIETMSTDFHAGTAAINLTGNTLDNVIYGNAGNNVLDGKQGNDALVGFGGADIFAFTTALGAGNVDILADFDANDVIALDDAVFTGLGLGALNANAFVVGTAAQDSNDRILYNSTTGALLFDADGNGAGGAVQFATLQGAPALTAADFVVI